MKKAGMSLGRRTERQGADGQDESERASKLRQYVERFPQAAVLVVGDLILDHYVWGRVTRISPEAPACTG